MVENSWGPASGYQGHLIMTDEWFDEYMFRLVVETKYASSKNTGNTETETDPTSCLGPYVCRRRIVLFLLSFVPEQKKGTLKNIVDDHERNCGYFSVIPFFPHESQSYLLLLRQIYETIILYSMANVIKLRKGLDINLKGKAAETYATVKEPGFTHSYPMIFLE